MTSAILAILIICSLGGVYGVCEAPRKNEDFTYQLCNVQLGFDATRNYCKEKVSKDSDLVVFYTKEEYDFVINHLQTYSNKSDSEVSIFIGVYQTRSNTGDPFRQYSGKFYWVRSPDQPITNRSSTYWKPFSRWITDFESIDVDHKHLMTLKINQDGTVVEGDQFNAANPSKATVLCQYESKSMPPDTVDIWVIVVIIASCLVLTITIIVIVVVVKKRNNKNRDFKKVSTDDRQPEDA